MRISIISLTWALAATTVFAQSNLGSSSTDAASSSGSAGVDDEKAKAAALAKATLNPIASLISLPLQNNFDWGAGPNDDGFQYKLNVQPVIPISLNEDWNVISRTIVPYVLGRQPIALQLGGRYYAEGPSGAPEWGLRFQISFLFPK